MSKMHQVLILEKEEADIKKNWECWENVALLGAVLKRSKYWPLKHRGLGVCGCPFFGAKSWPFWKVRFLRLVSGNGIFQVVVFSFTFGVTPLEGWLPTPNEITSLHSGKVPWFHSVFCTTETPTWLVFCTTDSSDVSWLEFDSSWLEFVFLW